MPFSVDPNIAKAKTLGTDFYLSRHFFESSKEKIFARTWQFIGDTDQVKEPGWVTPVHFLKNSWTSHSFFRTTSKGTSIVFQMCARIVEISLLKRRASCTISDASIMDEDFNWMGNF